MKRTTKEIIHELKHHSPLTLGASVIALIFALSLYQTNLPETIFEIAHPFHVIASAIVTAAIYHNWGKKIIPSILIGITGSILIGSLSDVLFPYLGGLIFNLNPEFHLPLIEEPLMIIMAALIGSLIGIYTGYTRIPHFMHVLISVFASFFYLLAYSQSLNTLFIILSSIIVFISVIVPCCLSDIVFPYLFLGDKIKHCNCH